MWFFFKYSIYSIAFVIDMEKVSGLLGVYSFMLCYKVMWEHVYYWECMSYRKIA